MICEKESGGGARKPKLQTIRGNRTKRFAIGALKRR